MSVEDGSIQRLQYYTRTRVFKHRLCTLAGAKFLDRDFEKGFSSRARSFRNLHHGEWKGKLMETNYIKSIFNCKKDFEDCKRNRYVDYGNDTRRNFIRKHKGSYTIRN
ncbi:hypothetical protein JL09_g3379 [Pichia kudriavzevii]|uniref:Uncharacterized protein n=1 Tax=Pichia kudriavzevii TaxID=4909 RepID=A0A099NZR4_PICKU|nr:hypothetical protein JL09_g3379 [Pichia kudriavzevii]